MKFITSSLALLLFTFSSHAQNAVRVFENLSADLNSPIIIVNDGEYRFRLLSEQIIETTFVPKGESYNGNSHAVILQPNFENSYKMQSTSEQVVIGDDSALKVVIQKKPFSIAYFYKNEKIISEKEGYHKDAVHHKLGFELQPSEKLMGGGARVLGMNRRGNRLQLYNRAHYGYETRSELMNFTLPIVISAKKYMLHFDNASIGYLDLDSQKTIL